MNFLAIDVETANADLASVCQIGVAEFRENAYYDGWKSFVNPQDEFDEINISIHRIEASDVANAPTWLEISDKIQAYVAEKVIASHTAFDRLAVNRVSARYNIEVKPNIGSILHA